jgi:2-methylcitrate dehydratase
MSLTVESNVKPDFDQELQKIADYVFDESPLSEEAYQTARFCLMDTLGCGILALQFDACKKMLGPTVPGNVLENGARVPGLPYELCPVQAAFNIGTMVRWLDFNDTWLAAEWGHPSDNLGAILAVCDYVTRQNIKSGKAPLLMKDVLTAMIKAHEIQGGLALLNSFNRVGLDHVILVKVASIAVVTKLLGGDRDAVLRALSQAFVDGQSLRTYRHAPNAGSRKSWAAGDATRRAVELSLITLKGEMGYPSCLSAKTWGFYDVLFKGKRFEFQREFGSYVMENVLFKLSFPAEFHAQTAVECAVFLHEEMMARFDDVERIELTTHESAIRIISKEGELHNPADRDHCLQYMVAIGLLFGTLKAEHYEDEMANDARIDALRAKMVVKEDKRYSEDYHDPSKRSIANAMQIFYKDGSHSERVEIEYPIGHRRRREEGMKVLKDKFERNLATHYNSEQCRQIIALCADQQRFSESSVDEFMRLW